MSARVSSSWGLSMSTRIVKVNPRSNHRPYRQYKLKNRVYIWSYNQEYCSYYASHRTSLITYSIMQNRRIIKDMTNNKRKWSGTISGETITKKNIYIYKAMPQASQTTRIPEGMACFKYPDTLDTTDKALGASIAFLVTCIHLSLARMSSARLDS